MMIARGALIGMSSGRFGDSDSAVLYSVSPDCDPSHVRLILFVTIPVRRGMQDVAIYVHPPADLPLPSSIDSIVRVPEIRDLCQGVYVAACHRGARGRDSLLNFVGDRAMTMLMYARHMSC